MGLRNSVGEEVLLRGHLLTKKEGGRLPAALLSHCSYTRNILSSYIEWSLRQSAQSALALLDTKYVSRSVGDRLFQKGLQN